MDQASINAIVQNILPFGIVIVVFYFLMIAPQRKKEKQTREMISALVVGDEILTIGGFYGKIIKIKDDILTLEIQDGKVKISKWAIREVVKKYEGKPKVEDSETEQEQ